MIFIAIALTLLGLAIAGLVLHQHLLLKRIDNCHARVMRLEQVEDQRHGFEQAMAEKNSNVIKLRCKPKEDCDKCHGRGHIGKNTVTNMFVPCTCCS